MSNIMTLIRLKVKRKAQKSVFVIILLNFNHILFRSIVIKRIKMTQCMKISRDDEEKRYQFNLHING